jgi:CRP-like cAMP-binding protein
MLEPSQLLQFPLFSGMPDQKLEPVARMCTVSEYAAGDTIFRQDDDATHLFGVLDGEVELRLLFKDKILKTDIQWEESIKSRFEVVDRPINLETLGPNEVFGWSSLVSQRKMTASAVCSKPGRLFSIPGADLKSLLQEDQEIGFSVMDRLADLISGRLHTRTDRLVEAWVEAFGVSRAD